MKPTAAFITFASIIFGFSACTPLKAEQGMPEVKDFNSCVAAGFPVVKTAPPRCISKDGRVFFSVPVRKDTGGICNNQCGDGVCQQIVCMGSGCPCAETPQNCPKDCAQTDHSAF